MAIISGVYLPFSNATISGSSSVTTPVKLAAHHLDDYPEALATAICVGGDCDTNAAIVGGIVASGVGREGIPADWLNAKEPFTI